MGVKGSNNVAIRISNDRKFIYFVCSNSHFMFLLFINESIVTGVEDFSHMYKHMWSSAMMTVSVGRISSFKLCFSYIFSYFRAILFQILFHYRLLQDIE